VGYADKVEKLNLSKDMHHNMALRVDGKLPEVVVDGDLNSPLLTTQTGKRSFSNKDIKTEFALMSSPDVVKTLQRVSGVAEGQELASGLYVHGGNGDENLFLIDGTPLYNTNHALGLFSSFNADVVKNVDFYKSGFPARYGGRLSSVVDVRTADGNMNQFHGAYRIGLLDASVQFEGPIQKGKTSYNIGMRRSWLDLLSRPLTKAFSDPDEKLSIGYYFMDLNAKVTHRFNDRSKIDLSLYHGKDSWDVTDDMDDSKGDWYHEGDSYNKELTKTQLNWGNFNVALNWNYLFSPKLFANFTAVYSHNRSKLYSLDNDREIYPQTKNERVWSHLEHGYTSTIYDAGYRTAFDYRPNPRHHIRFGHDYTMHLFRPQTVMQLDYMGGGSGAEMDTIRVNSTNRHVSHEWSAYAEDEICLSDKWSLDAGFHLGLFHISDKNFFNIDPRFALKYQWSHAVSLKASFTQMTQYVHKISNSYLDLPTDYWVPTTKDLKPMRSYQIAAGIYAQPNRHWILSLEGYYKLSKHLLQYSSWLGIEPPAENWDSQVMDGKGLFYGLEADATYRTNHLTLSGSYTLSWNKRKYDEFYQDWYYDKYDNRHKLNLSLRYDFNRKVSCYAVWSYHSGNHATVPTQIAALPGLPDGGNRYPGSWWNSASFVYAIPNNLTLPAYHRLDLGFDFHHVTKHGHERIWNLSIYNAYCHLNSMYVKVDYDEKTKRFRAKNKGFVPIIPSFSYTIKF
jgi:outer membrane receptor for ferrienterochelin and colicin